MAFLEFLLAAAGAGVIAADVFQRVAHRFLVRVTAVRAMHMTLFMGVLVAMVVSMAVIVVAVWAVDVFLLSHVRLLRDKFTGNYLAIARHVHASSEHQAGFHPAL